MKQEGAVDIALNAIVERDAQAVTRRVAARW
jgi:hypothetical protein